MNDHQNWVMIYSSTLDHEVNIYQALLKDADIESVIINKKDSLYLFGEVELYVNTEDALMAKQIITSASSE
ncbi:MAG: DUF2007 domain-containing protein [Bacteroidetes bacterium]|nr:DUF2007 domain-containing protein [Bacteroidota bacterium]